MPPKRGLLAIGEMLGEQKGGGEWKEVKLGKAWAEKRPQAIWATEGTSQMDNTDNLQMGMTSPSYRREPSTHPQGTLLSQRPVAASALLAKGVRVR